MRYKIAVVSTLLLVIFSAYKMLTPKVPVPIIVPAPAPPAAATAPAPLVLVPAIPYDENQKNLPRVLCIGDSISFGYAEPVAKKLKDKAQVYRIQGRTAATVTGTLTLQTRSGLSNIDTWLEQKWDVIHFNWGLHDVRLNSKDRNAVPLEEYEKNLEKMIDKMQKTGAQLIWASTTPIPPGKMSPPRQQGDELRYNEAAARIMAAKGVAIDDLYTVADEAIKANEPNKVQQAANVHFTPLGSSILADAVVEAVSKALPQR